MISILKKSKSCGCNGQVYRFSVNTFINGKGCIVDKRIMTPMKRLSCSGCYDCQLMIDWLIKDLGYWDEYVDNLFKGFDNGELYKMVSYFDEDGYQKVKFERFDNK